VSGTADFKVEISFERSGVARTSQRVPAASASTGRRHLFLKVKGKGELVVQRGCRPCS
jgi:hypothetical protein